MSHRASEWVTEFVRRDETAAIEAEFDPETGVVTVYEGRPEFRKLESAARAHGYKKGRFSEFVPFRMLEVEAAANAVYHWAASELVRRRVSEERPLDPRTMRKPCDIKPRNSGGSHTGSSCRPSCRVKCSSRLSACGRSRSGARG